MKKISRTSEITRRTFCNGALLASSALVLRANGLTPAATQPRQGAVAYPPLKIEGAETLLPGSHMYFNYPTHNDEAVLFRAQDGEYFAYSRKCAHRGCTVDFSDAQRCLVCPCHRGAYDARSGFVIFGPPPRPLDAILLQMRAGGQVWAVGKSVIQTDRNS